MCINLQFIDTTEFDNTAYSVHKCLEGVHGIIVPGGYGVRGTEGMIRVIEYARERQVPYLGLCFGFNWRRLSLPDMCGLEKATSTEFEPHTPEPLIALLPEQEQINDLGETRSGWVAMMSRSFRAAACIGSTDRTWYVSAFAIATN